MMRRASIRSRGPRLRLSRPHLRGRAAAREQLAQRVRPKRRRRRGISALTLLIVAALAAWAAYNWWQRRQQEHARLLEEAPEPWAPPADPAPAPPPPESEPEPVVDEQPPPTAVEPETAPAFSSAEPDERASASSERRIAPEPAPNAAAAPAEEPQSEPLSESAGIPGSARPLGPGAHHNRALRPAAPGVSPLPNDSFAPAVRAPAMPRSGWEPPIGR